MIIEVDDKTGKATTYKSMYEFTFAHSKELDEIYEKKFAPEVELNFWNRELLEEQLPSGAGKIVCITSHRSYIVCKCENGEVYSFDRTGETPYFKLDLKPWQK